MFQKKKALNHFFGRVFQQLLKPPYALQFFLSFHRFAIKDESHGESVLEVMGDCLKNISDEDIDMMLYYDTEAALQIVNDLADTQVN